MPNGKPRIDPIHLIITGIQTTLQDSLSLQKAVLYRILCTNTKLVTCCTVQYIGWQAKLASSSAAFVQGSPSVRRVMPKHPSTEKQHRHWILEASAYCRNTMYCGGGIRSSSSNSSSSSSRNSRSLSLCFWFWFYLCCHGGSCRCR